MHVELLELQADRTYICFHVSDSPSLPFLEQELEGTRESESALRVECSREKVSSAQLRDTLTRERALTQELSAQVEHLTGQLGSSSHTQATVDQLQVRIESVSSLVTGHQLSGSLILLPLAIIVGVLSLAQRFL